MLSRALILLLLSFTPSLVLAAVIPDLYDTKVKVASQTVAAQNDAIRESFNQVLIKVSGTREIVSNATVLAQRSTARDLIQSFRFESTPNGTFLIASFDELKINQLLTSMTQPVWGKRRPDTLLWMAWLDKDGERKIISATTEDPTKAALLRSANSRGIPLSFPLMDIEDSETVHVFDVWGRFDGVLKQASQRYPNDNLVTARMFDRQNMVAGESETTPEMRYQLDWQVLNDELIEEGSLFAESETDVIDKFVNLLADRLSEKYAVVATGPLTQNVLNIKIINLDSIEKYVSATRFLESLAMINGVKLHNMKGKEATFELLVVGDQTDLLNILQLDAKISRKTDAFGRAVEEMEFLWLQ